MAAPRARAAAVVEPLPEQPQLSIIIPVLNEADCLDQNLARLFALPAVHNHCEVIVSDGGSGDQSLEIAQGYPCQIVHSDAGRATQLNTARRIAGGRILLFLHADSSLPPDFSRVLDSRAAWGFYRLRLADRGFAFRVIEKAINLRTRTSRIAGGDQGLFFESLFFDSIGGFPEIPLMEDIAICKLARRRARPAIIETEITTSGRRWREYGIVKTVLLMWSLRFAFWLGADPGRLHKFYYPERG
jgi:rSAM/selenodomain-associated transferase 2